MAEWITLVDDNDIPTGFAEKIYVHKRALLHRAFSVFVVNENNGKILLQKRSKGKYHSGGLWSNTCCSHQYRSESLFEAVQRRLNQELGINLICSNTTNGQGDSVSVNCEIREIGVFRYFKQFSDLAENEIDHVFLVAINNKKYFSGGA
jgi:isopentenyl-diphosphate delta-isomerase